MMKEVILKEEEPLWKRLSPLTIAIIEKCFRTGLLEEGEIAKRKK